MATRHQARMTVVSLLYSFDYVQNSEHVNDYLEEHKIRNAIREWALELFNGVQNNLSKIDECLKCILESNEVNNLGGMEKAILRLGVYELLFTKTDKAVIINEAIELAKEYASDNAPKLINGVLDKVRV